MNPLRVLSLATLYPNRQTPNFGVFVEAQMRAVAARGDIELTIINPIGMPPMPLALHPKYRPLRRLPREQHDGALRILRPRFRLWPGLGAQRNAAAIVRAVLPLTRALHAAAPFDVIDAQFFFPDGPAAAQIARTLRLPCSIKARGADIHHWGRHPLTAGQVLDSALAADAILAVSSGIADDIAALGVPRGKIAVHHTGLDHRIFRPHDKSACRALLGLPAKGVILACVGALIERKGQALAIEALADLPGAMLVLAGAGPDERALRKRAAALDVADRVRFLGAVPHEQLPVLLSAADVFVLPTRSEGLANAWVEALACGTPVITPPLPGALEVITEPAHGRLAERDPAAIAEAVRDVLAKPPTARKVMAGAARFTWEANAQALTAHWAGLARRG